MAYEGQAVPAQNIFGNYEILDTVGRGGMGVVYRALDLALDRVVALKVLRTELYTRPLLVSRFEREARAIAQLNHPNIVETYSTGSVGKIPYIAMELIKGPPLSEVLREAHRLPWERALGIAEQVAAALACAQKAQIIHRDIKPPNILVAENDHVFVTDFGLAKLLTIESQLTAEGSLLGTPQYMAPEQCRRNEATVLSDLYSLGVVLFVMISGRLPYRVTDKAHLISTVISGRPVRLREYVPEAPEEVEKLIAYLMEKDPKDRPPTAEAVCEAIARVRQGKPLDTADTGVAKALAHLREETTELAPSNVRTPTAGRVPRTKKRVTAKSRLKNRWRRVPAMLRHALVLGAVALLGAGFGLGMASLLYPDPGIDVVAAAGSAGGRWKQPAHVAEFIESRPGTVMAEFNLPGFTVADVQWAGAGDCAVAQLDGIGGTPRAGQRAIGLVSPSTQHASLALPPIGTHDGRSRLTPVVLAGSPKQVPENSPLKDRFLVLCDVFGRLEHVQYQSVVACGVRNESAFTVFEVAVPSSAHNSRPVSSARGIAAFDVNAHAETVAAAMLTEGEEGSWTLVQDRMTFRTAAGQRIPLTTQGGRIAVVQYSPDGSRIAYLRELEEDENEVWLVRSDGTELDGTLLAQGDVFFGSQAFSPDGTRLIVAEGFDSGQPALRIMRVIDRSVETDLGQGWMGAWHPSGEFIVLTARDAGGEFQLWAVPPQDPDARVQLTDGDPGTGHLCSVSTDGEWASFVPTDVQTPAVGFVNLSEIRF